MLKEPAEAFAFTAGEGCDGSIVDLSTIVCGSSSWVTRTNLIPLVSALVLVTALTSLVAHGVLRRTAGGSRGLNMHNYYT